MGLDECIERSYDGLPVDSRDCDRVIDCLFEIFNAKPDFRTWRERDIKVLSKVGHHAVRVAGERFTVPVLVQLFEANVEGATRADQTREREDNGHLTLAGHLHTYAADVAKLLYKRTDNQKYLEAAYTHRLQAGHKTQTRDPGYASHCYSFAAEYARELWNKTKDHRWAIRDYQSNMLVVAYTTAERHMALSYLRAANAAEEVWKCVHQKIWLQRAVQAYHEFLTTFDLAREPDLTRLYHAAERSHRELSGVLKSQR